MTAVRDQLLPQKPPGSRFRFSCTGVQPSPGSSTIELPSAFAESGAYPPDRKHQALRDSAPCLSRAATLPKATKLELGRGAHLKTPSSANHTAAASQPTGRIAKAASCLHLSRVSPALLPPERPSHTHTPKPGFGGIVWFRSFFSYFLLKLSSICLNIIYPRVIGKQLRYHFLD